MSDCKNNVPCGCQDSALESQPPCNSTGPCASQACPEVFCTDCIVNCNDPYILVLERSEVTVEHNESLTVTLEKIAAHLADTTDGGKIAINLRKLSVTDTTISFAWDGDSTITYTPKIYLTGETAGTPVVGSGTYSFINLLSKTAYILYVTDSNSNKNGIWIKINNKDIYLHIPFTKSLILYTHVFGVKNKICQTGNSTCFVRN